MLDMGGDFKVPASGTLEYTYFVLKAPFAEDKWVEKAELRPVARSAMHHIVLTNRAAGSEFPKEAQPGGALCAKAEEDQ